MFRLICWATTVWFTLAHLFALEIYDSTQSIMSDKKRENSITYGVNILSHGRLMINCGVAGIKKYTVQPLMMLANNEIFTNLKT